MANSTLVPCLRSHTVPLDSDDESELGVAKRAKVGLHGWDIIIKPPHATPIPLSDLSQSTYSKHKLIIAGGRRKMKKAESRCMFKLGASAYCWMFEDEQWRPCASMKHPRTNFSSVVLKGELYVFGGWYDGTITSECEVYSPKSDSWRTFPALNNERLSFVCGVVRGSVIVAGGWTPRDDIGILRSAEVYCPQTNRWNLIAPLIHAASGATACVLNGCLFVVGGNHLDSLQMWDTTKWTLKARMPSSRSAAASVVYNGKIIVLGGTLGKYVNDKFEYQPTDSVVVYDPQTNTWAVGAPLPEPRASCRAVEHAGSIILIGGGGPPLEFKNNKWNELPDVPGGTPHACSIGLI